MNDFKIGDKVVCIDEAGCGLEKGCIYTVDKYLPNDVITLIEVYEQRTYYTYRFELAKEVETKFKSGDKVVCIDANSTESFSFDLTVGNIYTINKLYGNHVTLMEIGVYLYGINRFELFEEKEVEEMLSFDINADISRQYTRSGKKVNKIVSFEFDVAHDFPLLFSIEGGSSIRSATINGLNQPDEIGDYDIVTRPLSVTLKPILKSYFETYIAHGNILATMEFYTMETITDANKHCPEYTHISVDYVEYDPNTNTLTRTPVSIPQS